VFFNHAIYLTCAVANSILNSFGIRYVAQIRHRQNKINFNILLVLASTIVYIHSMNCLLKLPDR